MFENIQQKLVSHIIDDGCVEKITALLFLSLGDSGNIIDTLRRRDLLMKVIAYIHGECVKNNTIPKEVEELDSILSGEDIDIPHEYYTFYMSTADLNLTEDILAFYLATLSQSTLSNMFEMYMDDLEMFKKFMEKMRIDDTCVDLDRMMYFIDSDIGTEKLSIIADTRMDLFCESDLCPTIIAATVNDALKRIPDKKTLKKRKDAMLFLEYMEELCSKDFISYYGNDDLKFCPYSRGVLIQRYEDIMAGNLITVEPKFNTLMFSRVRPSNRHADRYFNPATTKAF